MDWSRIKLFESPRTSSSDECVIELPVTLAEQMEQQVVVHFGQRAQQARVQATADEQAVGYLSAKLRRALLVPDSLTYELRCSAHDIHIGPVIGLLLGEQKYMYHHRNMGEFTDAMRVYPEVGGLIIAFKSVSIDWQRECVHGLYYHGVKQRWEYGTFPLPSAVYLRAFNIPSDTMHRLQRVTGGRVFNSVRYNKWEMYQKVRHHSVLEPHVPETVLVTSVQDVFDMLNKHERIILKPIGLSRARGICIMKALDDAHVQMVDYTTGSEKYEYVLHHKEIVPFLQNKKMLNLNYIVQPHLKLARIQGSPWDVRVVMQKNADHKWQCSGIECRHAGATDWITNISRGGRALHLPTAAKLSFGSKLNMELLQDTVMKVAQTFCQVFDDGDDHFAEWGLDLAIDTKQRVWLIEANVRPTFNGFKKMDEEMYRYICGVPILYAASLAMERGDQA